jgi:hypothetical protein
MHATDRARRALQFRGMGQSVSRYTLRDLQHWKPAATGRVHAHTVLCPECGCGLDVAEDVEAFDPRTNARRVVARLAVCYGCEFTFEF